MAGAKMAMRFKGGGPAFPPLGSEVAAAFQLAASAITFPPGGKVRALGVTGSKRSDVFPDVPTVAEAGLPGYEAALRYGIVAPAGTPRPIVDKLNAALRQALADPDTVKRMATRWNRAIAVDAGGIRRRHRRPKEVNGRWW